MSSWVEGSVIKDDVAVTLSLNNLIICYIKNVVFKEKVKSVLRDERATVTTVVCRGLCSCWSEYGLFLRVRMC